MARDLHLLTRLFKPFRYLLPVFLFALISLTSKAQCPPTVVATPASASVCMGDSVQMVCSPSTGTTWQWYKDGAPIPGATSSTCYAFGDGNYTVMTGSCAFPSNTITVVMKPLPTISISSTANTICSPAPGYTFNIASSPWEWVVGIQLWRADISCATAWHVDKARMTCTQPAAVRGPCSYLSAGGAGPSLSGWGRSGCRGGPGCGRPSSCVVSPAAGECHLRPQQHPLSQ